MNTKSHLVRVIAAIVDEKQLTLYVEDGSTLSILQGDPRLAKIIKIITPILAEGPGSVAEINLEEDAPENTYRQYEEQAKGGVSFFKVAKTRLAGWLSKAAEVLVAAPAATVAPQTIGALPTVDVALKALHSSEPEVEEPAAEPTKAEKLLSVADEIIKHAQPVKHPEFHDRDVGDKGDSTIVAVVGNKVVADIEKLKPQLKRAVKSFSTKGMDTFMQRVAAVTDKRRHSVEDLLKFLERGDLPIADDGCIVIYKVLKRHNGKYVDCHTKQVTQQVGSYVCMDANMVDPSRRNECSNGLHVARRAYVGGFYGDVVVLAKVRPEDVIAVPDYDANKMRVCGYHILFELSNEAFAKLKQNQAFTDSEEAQLLLGRALAGDHPEPTEEVRITQGMGNGVKITPWIKLNKASAEIEAPVPKETKAEAPALAPASARAEAVEAKPVVKAVEALPDEATKEGKLTAAKVDPKAVVKDVIEAKAAVETRADKAKRLYVAVNVTAKGLKYDLKAANELLEFKKKSKLGWVALGLSADTGDVLQRILNKNQQK